MGESKHDGLAIPGRVVLAHEPPFKLGKLKVEPATRQVETDRRSETLEPRVMQALVALARADGRIVTRDELIERCWEGRIVTDDAVNRVLARIRQLASGIGAGSFALETITKVGYRLISDVSPPLPAFAPEWPAADFPRRRLLIGGSAAVITAVAGYGLWSGLRPAHRASSEALALYRKGVEVWQQGYFQNFDQAEAWFRQAVEADPQFAEAWGAMALTITTALLFAPEDHLQKIADRSRSAAERALVLDRDQPSAKAALALIPGAYRHWRRADAQLTAAFTGLPGDWFVGSQLGALLSGVGRWDDSIRILQRVCDRNPYIPFPHVDLAYALLEAGRTIEAGSLTARSIERWPQHTGTWVARMDVLIEIGQPDAALAMAANPHEVPEGLGDILPLLVGAAKAIASNAANEIADFRKTAIASAERDIRWAAFAAFKLNAMKRADDTFEFLDAYYLRRGKLAAKAPPIGPLTRVDTDVLFLPSMRSAWRDPRFAALTSAIGLNDYWRSIGYTPPQLR